MYNVREQGRKEGKTEVVKKLLEKNMNIEEIQEITDLTKDEIEEIISGE